jgi:hypothetical protein
MVFRQADRRQSTLRIFHRQEVNAAFNQPKNREQVDSTYPFHLQNVDANDEQRDAVFNVDPALLAASETRLLRSSLTDARNSQRVAFWCGNSNALLLYLTFH